METEHATQKYLKDPKTVHLLYGHKAVKPAYTEEILCSFPEHFERVKILAARDGFTGFRTAIHRDGEPVNFGATVSI